MQLALHRRGLCEINVTFHCKNVSPPNFADIAFGSALENGR
jgi:hypothetical protein